MTSEVKELLGKTITGVIAKENPRNRPPKSQLFLIFSDNTYCEFYCGDSWIEGGKGLWTGGAEKVRRYMSDGPHPMKIVADYQLGGPENLDQTTGASPTAR